MGSKLSRICAFLAVAIPLSVYVGGGSSPASGQGNRCDQIRDPERRQRCRWADADAQRYAEEARGWREEEARIRRDHEQACRRVGMVARFIGQGRTLRAVCEAPRRIYDARTR